MMGSRAYKTITIYFQHHTIFLKQNTYIRIIIFINKPNNIMKTLKFSLFFLLSLCCILPANAITYEPIPNFPERYGFYYRFNDSDYAQILHSNMPYEIMAGYIVTDSIMRYCPNSIAVENFVLDSIHYGSDTLKYFNKYLYLLEDYDPVRYYMKLSMPDTALVYGSGIKGWMYTKFYEMPEAPYVFSDYILHIKANKVVRTESINNYDATSGGEDIIYCKVLDTIKGRVFPSLNSAIFYNGLEGDTLNYQQNTYQGVSRPITPITDIVFSYCHRWNTKKWPASRRIGPGRISPDKEYIVFLRLFSGGATDSSDYVCLSPYAERNSFSMYPIEDGFVKDEGNVLGFGENVPVDEFKQHLQEKISEIVNYDGE
jgi:hypothetical protein